MKQLFIFASMLAGLASCTKETNEDVFPATTQETAALVQQNTAYIVTCGSSWQDFTQHNGRFEELGYDLYATEPNATLEINFPSTRSIQYGIEITLNGTQTAVLEVMDNNNQVVHTRTYTVADSGHNAIDDAITVCATNMTKIRLRFVDGGYITYAYIISR